MANHPQFTIATKAPKDLEGTSLSDWYNEMLHYCKVGYTHRGNRISGDYFWFLNFYRINLNYRRADGVLFDEIGPPSFCQTDDWLFKQIEEAHEFDVKKPKILLVTGRAYGKTHVSTSIGLKGFYTKDNFTGVISSSTESLVLPTFNVFRSTIDHINKQHPSLAISLLKNTNEELQIGEIITDEAGAENKKVKSSRGYLERIIYSKKDVTRGRRLDFQHFEEVGAWNQPGVGLLADCLTASEGTFGVGEYKKCRVFLTGTGGSVTSGALRDIFYNPDEYNIFVPKDYDRRKAIFIPSHMKWGGTYEMDGIPDVERATKMLLAERKVMEGNIDKYMKHCSEFPLEEDEVFRLSGTNTFPQHLIAQAIQRVTVFKTAIVPVRGWFAKTEDSENGSTIKFIPDKLGEVWMYEDVERHKDSMTGVVKSFDNLYLAGYDGIDQGLDDSSSKDGSNLAFVMKKGMNPNWKTSTSYNKYILVVNYRPRDVEDAYEQCMFALMYYNGKVNIEFSKINIVSYFKKHNQTHRFMMRPKLTVGDGLQDKDSKLIGTIANATTWGFGLSFIKEYIKEFWESIDDLALLMQMKDFTYERKTDFDLISAMCWCEIGYDDLVVKPQFKQSEERIRMGYWTDPFTGKMSFGKKPVSTDKLGGLATNDDIKYLDLRNNKIVYND